MSAHTILLSPLLAPLLVLLALVLSPLLPLVLSPLLVLSSLALPLVLLALVLSSLLPVRPLHPAPYASQRLPAMASASFAGLQLHHSFVGKDWRRRKEGSEATALLWKSAFLHGT